MSTAYSGRKIHLAVALPTMLFEASERLDLLPVVVQTKDRALSAYAKKASRDMDGDARKRFAASAVQASIAKLDSGAQVENPVIVQQVLLDNLFYLLGTLPSRELKDIHGIVATPDDDGKVTFTPFITRDDFTEALDRLRSIYQGVSAPPQP